MRAKHTLSAGFEIRRIENNTFTDPTPEGQFSFSNLMTAQLNSSGNPITAAPGTLNGYDFASFLLGLPSATNVRFGTPSSYFRSWGYIGYFTDDWRARPNLTLEYGVALRSLHAALGTVRPLLEPGAELQRSPRRPWSSRRRLRSCSTALAGCPPPAWCKAPSLHSRQLRSLGAALRHRLAPAAQSA